VTPKIAVLPAQVADQIAAGEVVERPASVVKELVENALDAGARTVRVAIENGGKTLIRVSDDGEGMSREDAELALARHATSKIRGAADLIGVGTFGFRGEALPAIASVSRFELETSPDGRSGSRVRLVGGKGMAVEDAVRQRGTTVTVRALFFNTPARRKFLRAQQTETRAVVEALTALALARPDVAFALASDERALLDVGPAARPIDRVHELWGRELADTLLPSATARAHSRCGASRSVPRRRSPRDAKATCWCGDAPSAILSSCARGSRGTARPSRPATARRSSCSSSSRETRWTSTSIRRSSRCASATSSSWNGWSRRRCAGPSGPSPRPPRSVSEVRCQVSGGPGPVSVP